MEKLQVNQTEELITDKCWKLSSYLMAQYDFKELTHPANEYWCKFGNEFKESFEKNFFKELIELAGLLRAILDMHSLSSENYEVVGKIKYENKEIEDLDYRESCNKIIHAEFYSIEFIKTDSHPLDNKKNGYNDSDYDNYKNPTVITEGFYRKTKWKSELTFINFIDETLNILNHR
jgi:hypothetical protein